MLTATALCYKDIKIPSLLWGDVGCELRIAGDTTKSHAPRSLFELVEAELDPYCADGVEDRGGAHPEERKSAVRSWEYTLQ